MKNYLYCGGPAMNGATFRDGREVILHKGKVYTLDENDPYTLTMLAKQNENGMPAPWLVEVVEEEGIASPWLQEMPAVDVEDTSDGEQQVEPKTKRRR
jgi:hypothetical protein